MDNLNLDNTYYGQYDDIDTDEILRFIAEKRLRGEKVSSMQLLTIILDQLGITMDELNMDQFLGGEKF